jgi:DNA uptake protein ComE-like DNA-binding protein
MLLRSQPSVHQERRGVVLITVLVVVVVLTLAAYQYSEYMQAEYTAAHSHAKMAQTKAFAMSGVNSVAVMLSNSDFFNNTLNGNPYDNPQYFQDILVQDDPNPKRRGRFSIIGLVSPDEPQFSTQPYLFGAVDEAGKINLNALLELDKTGNIGQQILLQLPNMTEDIANSILDWMDPNTSSPRSNGAKDEYYMNLTPPYHCKNGPFDSLEELLLVKGVTPQLLYGNDLNRNGVLDPNEDDGTGVVDRGWSAYVTVYSREPNADAQGNARIYLNNSDLNALYQQLEPVVGADLANYIIAYRTYGSSTPAAATVTPGQKGVTVNGQPVPSGAAGPAQGATTKLNDQDADDVNTTLQSVKTNPNSKGQAKPLASVYNLINSSVSITVGSGNQQRTVTLQSPLNDPGQQKTLLPLLLDGTTTLQGNDLPPRININTASQTVLSALPMFTDADVQAIISARPDWTTLNTAPDPIFNTPAWLLTEAKLSPAALSAAERYITARSGIYSFQAIGYFDGGGAVTRLEAVIDTNYGRPRIVHIQDLSETGKGFPVPFNGTSSGTTSNLSSN